MHVLYVYANFGCKNHIPSYIKNILLEKRENSVESLIFFCVAQNIRNFYGENSTIRTLCVYVFVY